MKTVVTLLITHLPLLASAQSEIIFTQELNEVVIQAPIVIRKADMDVYRPSKSAVDNSKNGMQLLRNLMIPTLTVNEALGTISAAGQSVQVRINGQTCACHTSASATISNGDGRSAVRTN